MKSSSHRLLNKGLRLVVVAGLCFFLTSAATGKEKEDSTQDGGLHLSLKISGGAGFLFNGAGDLERFRSGRSQFASDYRQIAGSTSTFDWKKLSMIPDINAEIMLELGSHFGIGIGSGFLNATSKGTYSLQGTTTQNPWWGTSTETETDTYSQNYRIRAVPVTLNFYYFRPLGAARKFNLYVYGGAGYYFAKLTHAYKDEYAYHYEDNSWIYFNEKENYQFTSTAGESSKQNRIGFRAGLGLEMGLSSFLSVGIEAFGRLVNFSNWTGDYSDSWTSRDQLWQEKLGWFYDQTSSGASAEHGNLYMYNVNEAKLNKNYPAMWIWQSQPEGSAISSIRKASINLNAIGALISVRLRFGL